MVEGSGSGLSEARIKRSRVSGSGSILVGVALLHLSVKGFRVHFQHITVSHWSGLAFRTSGPNFRMQQTQVRGARKAHRRTRRVTKRWPHKASPSAFAPAGPMALPERSMLRIGPRTSRRGLRSLRKRSFRASRSHHHHHHHDARAPQFAIKIMEPYSRKLEAESLGPESKALNPKRQIT